MYRGLPRRRSPPQLETEEVRVPISHTGDTRTRDPALASAPVCTLVRRPDSRVEYCHPWRLCGRGDGWAGSHRVSPATQHEATLRVTKRSKPSRAQPALRSNACRHSSARRLAGRRCPYHLRALDVIVHDDRESKPSRCACARKTTCLAPLCNVQRRTRPGGASGPDASVSAGM